MASALCHRNFCCRLHSYPSCRVVCIVCSHCREFCHYHLPGQSSGGVSDKRMEEQFMTDQYKPELRPKMSDVVKMLEGSMEIQDPPNPFQHLMEENHQIEAAQMDSSIDDGSSTLEGMKSSTVPAHPVLEIQIDSSKN
ncbi:hypothetical protein K1719_039305 [Acacia pycnantha]|nr:hypothetical protein K1719_039305 [Acacia pycnantha]